MRQVSIPERVVRAKSWLVLLAGLAHMLQKVEKSLRSSLFGGLLLLLEVEVAQVLEQLLVLADAWVDVLDVDEWVCCLLAGLRSFLLGSATLELHGVEL